MHSSKTTQSRRSFLKNTVLAGGGLVIGFDWLTSVKMAKIANTSAEQFALNAYLKIDTQGGVTIYSPNPEFGQNVMTSMPMIVAEELDVDWKSVTVEQAPYDAQVYGFQFTGGSRGIMSKWKPLRTAGASARHMLCEAAAQTWGVPAAAITTEAGMVKHAASGRSAGYGEMVAAAAKMPVPKEVNLKEVKDFRIIGHSKRNVACAKIVSGKPLFSMDYQQQGMLIAMIEHPPAFGMTFQALENADEVKAMPGIKDVFSFKTYNDQQPKGAFDTNAFPEVVAIVGDSTWQVLNAKKALRVKWQAFAAYSEIRNGRGGQQQVSIPAGLESTTDHLERMQELAAAPGKIVRKDGDPEAAFRRAAKTIERTYTAPYLAHNCMEPINAFAEVKDGQVRIAGPVQAPGFIEPIIAERMGIPVENIEIEMTRMGGGFGRRAYSHYLLEAALIAQQAAAPIKLIYTREDDMTNGIYRPTYQATYRAALDENDNLLAIHIKAGGVPESPLFANRFPAGAVDHYLAEEWAVESNITIGAFRAPRSNFIAGAEQSFLDEVAELAGKDPIEFRLSLLRKAKNQPVGTDNDYDPDRYAGVLQLVKEKSDWEQAKDDVHRGVAAYFCHNTYAAHVLDLVYAEDGTPIVKKVCCALDCGIVVNPDAATNMAEGAIVDGIGNAFYGKLTFEQGVPQQQNFHSYRMIRIYEAPKEIAVHFVESEIDPTGLGEPPYPPIFGALANALYQATGTRHYQQPFIETSQLLPQSETPFE